MQMQQRVHGLSRHAVTIPSDAQARNARSALDMNLWRWRTNTVSTIASERANVWALTRPASQTPPTNARQQGDAKTGADAAKDRFQRAEFQLALHDDAAARQ